MMLMTIGSETATMRAEEWYKFEDTRIWGQPSTYLYSWFLSCDNIMTIRPSK